MNQYSTVSIKRALEEKGFVATTTSGMSMYPMLRNKRDCIVVKKAPPILKKYDVALYVTEKRNILHRVISVKQGLYVIRGDNCTFKEYVKPEQVIGILDSFTRNGKTYDCQTSRPYKIYCIFWCTFAPLRIAFTKAKLWIYKKLKGKR